MMSSARPRIASGYGCFLLLLFVHFLLLLAACATQPVLAQQTPQALYVDVEKGDDNTAPYCGANPHEGACKTLEVAIRVLKGFGGEVTTIMLQSGQTHTVQRSIVMSAAAHTRVITISGTENTLEAAQNTFLVPDPSSTLDTTPLFAMEGNLYKVYRSTDLTIKDITVRGFSRVVSSPRLDAVNLVLRNAHFSSGSAKRSVSISAFQLRKLSAPDSTINVTDCTFRDFRDGVFDWETDATTATKVDTQRVPYRFERCAFQHIRSNSSGAAVQFVTHYVGFEFINCTFSDIEIYSPRSFYAELFGAVNVRIEYTSSATVVSPMDVPLKQRFIGCTFERITMIDGLNPQQGAAISSAYDAPQASTPDNGLVPELFEIKNCEFRNCDYSGCVKFNYQKHKSIYPQEMRITNNRFQDALGTHGGFIHMSLSDAPHTVIIEGNEFSNGRSLSSGGAIYLSTAGQDAVSHLFTIRNNVFTNNTADGSGGAIYSTTYILTMRAGDEFLLQDNVFRNNHAGNQGGAVHLDQPSAAEEVNLEIRLLNNSFIENTAVYAAASVNLQVAEGIVSVLNNRFIRNQVPTGRCSALDFKYRSLGKINIGIFDYNVFIGGKSKDPCLGYGTSLERYIFCDGKKPGAAGVCGGYGDCIDFEQCKCTSGRLPYCSDVCPAGTVYNELTNECVRCSAGSVRPPTDPDTAACVPCRGGTYSPLSDEHPAYCKPCGYGNYSAQVSASTYCLSCPDGCYTRTSSTSASVNDCIPCGPSKIPNAERSGCIVIPPPPRPSPSPRPPQPTPSPKPSPSPTPSSSPRPDPKDDDTAVSPIVVVGTVSMGLFSIGTVVSLASAIVLLVVLKLCCAQASALGERRNLLRPDEQQVELQYM